MESKRLEKKKKKKEWFSDWFNSPYYHILYKNRDFAEAEKFIDSLCNYFCMSNTDRIADMACGQGRHAIYLNAKGCQVTGYDLSLKNITFASDYSNKRLDFIVHDMRRKFAISSFDYVLNLFTSFGYFKASTDDISALHAFRLALKPSGKIIIDFMNTPKIMSQLIPYESKCVDGIHFEIIKTVDDGFINKFISFEANNKRYDFVEQVKILQLTDFINYFDLVGLKIKEVFGNYQLHSYDPDISERMIFILENKI